MKIHVSELEGRALDYAVAVTQGGGLASTRPFFKTYLTMPGCGYVLLDDYSPSSDWAQCGPLIDEYKIDSYWHDEYEIDGLLHRNICECMLHDECFVSAGAYDAVGETMLIAACRAIVAAKLGDEVEIPDELVG